MALFARRKNNGRVAADARDDGPQLARRPTTIGDLLRETREQYGTTVEQVGAALRIRPVFLQAIEGNHYDRLPGPVYALGFVRTYADYLGLDGEAIAQRFKNEAAGLETKSDLSFPMPLPERSLPGGALLLVALIVAACAYAIWYYRAAGERSRTERVAEVPSQLIPLPPPAPNAAESAGAADNPAAGGATPPTSSAPSEQVAAIPPVPAAPSSPSAAPPVGSAGVSPTAEPSAAPAPPVAAMAPPPAPSPAPAAEPARLPAIPEPPAAAPALDTPRVYGVTNGPVRIIIKAMADSWVQVRDADQAVISMRVLKQGETYRVPDRPGMVLRTGNAGGLEITVDGKPVAPVGPPGKTRNVALDPQRLLAGSATLE